MLISNVFLLCLFHGHNPTRILLPSNFFLLYCLGKIEKSVKPVTNGSHIWHPPRDSLRSFNKSNRCTTTYNRQGDLINYDDKYTIPKSCCFAARWIWLEWYRYYIWRSDSKYKKIHRGVFKTFVLIKRYRKIYGQTHTFTDILNFIHQNWD